MSRRDGRHIAALGGLIAALLASAPLAQPNPSEQRPETSPRDQAGAQGEQHGASETPPEGNPIQAAPQAHDAAQGAHPHSSGNGGDQGRSLSPTDWIVATSALISALAGVAVAVFTWQLFEVGKRQHIAAMRSNVISRRSARAAAKAADVAESALINTQRPVLFLRHHVTELFSPDFNGHHREAVLRLRNTGTQPAIIEDYMITFILVDRGGEPPRPEGQPTLSALGCFPFETPEVIEAKGDRLIALRWPDGMPIDDAEALYQRRKFLYAVGTINYRDPLNIVRQLGFTAGFVPMEKGHREMMQLLDGAAYQYDRIIERRDQ